MNGSVIFLWIQIAFYGNTVKDGARAFRKVGLVECTKIKRITALVQLYTLADKSKEILIIFEEK